MEYKNGIKLGRMDVILGYEVYDNPKTSFLQAKTTFSESLSCLHRDLGWYTAHKEHSHMNRDILKMECIDLNTHTVLVEQIEWTLEDWVERRLLAKSRNIDTARQYYKRNLNKWWSDIESEFRCIFSCVIRGIRNLHNKHNFHGNVKKGIAITAQTRKSPMKAVLFDIVDCTMRDTADNNVRSRQKQDIEDIGVLIKYVLGFAFPNRTPWIPESIDMYFLRQIDDRASFYSTQTYAMRVKWDLDPVFFWDTHTIIKFLTAMHLILFRCAPTFNQRVTSVFVNADWIQKVRQSTVRNMKHVLNYNQGQNPYTTAMDKMRFWRNCMEHIPSNLNTPVNRSIIHDSIITVIPELLPEVVRAAHAMITDSSNTYDAYAAVLFKEMGWIAW